MHTEIGTVKFRPCNLLSRGLTKRVYRRHQGWHASEKKSDLDRLPDLILRGSIRAHVVRKICDDRRMIHNGVYDHRHENLVLAWNGSILQHLIAQPDERFGKYRIILLQPINPTWKSRLYHITPPPFSTADYTAFPWASRLLQEYHHPSVCGSSTVHVK